jgi:hypothetical protein
MSPDNTAGRSQVAGAPPDLLEDGKILTVFWAGRMGCHKMALGAELAPSRKFMDSCSRVIARQTDKGSAVEAMA